MDRAPVGRRSHRPPRPPPGPKLAPPPRPPDQLNSLAADLGIARNTVAEVYSQLVAEGWLTAQTGSGTSVALRSAGAATLAVEAYGHQAHRDIAAGQGLGLRPLPVDGMGAVIGEATGTDAVLLTPAHQFPLGVMLHPRRRREAADWGGVVIGPAKTHSPLTAGGAW